jgi:hypothetical protein
LRRQFSGAIAAAVALAACSAATAQERPKVAWVEPGDPPLYGVTRFRPDGSPLDLGASVAWQWYTVSPQGDFLIHLPEGASTLRARDLGTGEDREVPDLPISGPAAIVRSVWSQSTLWLVVRPPGGEGFDIVAVLPRVPSATMAARGLLLLRSSSAAPVPPEVHPAEGGDAAYVLSGEGEGTGVVLSVRGSDGRAPRDLGGVAAVVGGVLEESSHRIAYYTTRPDRAGYVVTLFDRDSGADVPMIPEARAFPPFAFTKGFSAIAYSTREGIVARRLGAAPLLMMAHLPDRRFAKSYAFTPDGRALLVEVPADKADSARQFLLIPVDSPSTAREVLRAPCAPKCAASRVVFPADGVRGIVSVGSPAEQAAQTVYRVDLVKGAGSEIATGQVTATMLSPSGALVAVVVGRAGSGATRPGELILCPTDPAVPVPPASLSVAARYAAGRFETPSVHLAFAPGKDTLLVTAAEAGGGRPRAFVVDAPGAAARAVSGDLIAVDARWSLSGEKVLISHLVAYAQGGAPLTALAVAAPGPPGTQPVTISGDRRIVGISECPDGSLLAITEARAAMRRVVISTKPEERLVLGSAVGAAAPVWAPDGRSVAYMAEVAPGLFAVYVGKPGAEAILVSGTQLVTARPMWVPGAERLLLLAPAPAARRPGCSLGLLASSGGGAPRVLGVMANPVLEPGGGGVLYASDDPRPAVYRAPLDKGQATLLAEGYDRPVPSPDGNAVLVVRDEPDGCAAGIVSGGQPVRELQGRFAVLAWSPDGRRLAAIEESSRQVRIVDAGDGGVTPMDLAPVLSVAWSPDGARLALLLGLAEGGYSMVAVGLDGRELARVPLPPGFRPMCDAPKLARGLFPSGRDFAWAPPGAADYCRVVGLSTDGQVEARDVVWAESAATPAGFDGSLLDYEDSPDGRRSAALALLVSRTPSEGRAPAERRRVQVTEGTSGRIIVVSGDLQVDGFAWLPDGRLAFWCSRGPDADSVGTFVASADGSGLFRLASAPGIVWPRRPPAEWFGIARTPPK